MLTAERQHWILEQLDLNGRVYAASAAEALGVSEDTIRRDLNKMAQLQQLRRVHGGALPLAQTTPDYIDRVDNTDSQKEAFARAAIGYLQAGQTILLDSGESCRQLARQLPQELPLTVVTGCPLIMLELARHPRVEVIALGGRFFKPALRTLGIGAAESLKTMRLDISFFGVFALHLQHGLSVNYVEEAEIMRVIVAQSDRTIVMGRSDALNKVAHHHVTPARTLDAIISDADIEPGLKAKFAELGVEVVAV